MRDPLGRVLIARRPDGAHLGGMWEFPGGKCQAGESARATLVRELREELDVGVQVATPILTISHRYPDRAVRIQAFRVERWTGRPRGAESQPVLWVDPGELSSYPFPSASRAIVNAARLPSVYLVSPDPGTRPRIRQHVDEVRRALVRKGIRLLQIRAPSLGRESFLEYAQALLEIAQPLGVEALANAPADWIGDLPRVGWHLTEQRLREMTSRPRVAGWLAASVHDRDGLVRAAALPVDFVVAGPVRHTQTHPGAEPLGVGGFAALCAASACPVFALGGMEASDLAAVTAVGGQGIAAIRGLLETCRA